MTEEVKERVSDEAYDPRYGARPIKRYITKNIENLIAHKVIDGNLKVGDTLVVSLDNDNYVISIK